MVDILSEINAAAKNMISLDNHAAKQLSLEERLLYLQGLALVMNADQEIHKEEKEYLKVLIRSFDIDDSVIEALEEFSLNPDQETIQSILRFFSNKDISKVLLLDMFMVANSDGAINDSELAVIRSLSFHLKINKYFFGRIISVFKELPKEPCAHHFSNTYQLPKQHFSHIFEYFNIEDVTTSQVIDGEVSNIELASYLFDMNYRGRVNVISKYLATVDGYKIPLDRFLIRYDSGSKMFYLNDKVIIEDKFIIELIKNNGYS